MRINKRGQIAEGIDWIAATIIIALILLASIILTGVIVKSHNPLGGGKTIPITHNTDVLAQKSFLAYLLTGSGNTGGTLSGSSGAGTVYNSIQSSGNLDSSTGPLASKIFTTLYGNAYPDDVFVGTGGPGAKNSYFKNGNGVAYVSFLTYEIHYAVSFGAGKLIELSLERA